MTSLRGDGRRANDDTMKPFHRTVATILFVLFAANLAAQGDAQAEARLKELGAQIKRTGGAVTELRIRGAKLGAAEYRLIGGLTALRTLNLGGRETALTDGHLALLSGLTNLEAIQSDGALLSDEGFRHFAAFRKLRCWRCFIPRAIARISPARAWRICGLVRISRN